jgi:hypothetical protein
MSRGAIDEPCTACKVAAGEPCRAYMGATLGDSYGKPRTGRFHSERVAAAAKATREANLKRKAEAGR